MRVLERMRVCFLWFRGHWDVEATDGGELCPWCNETLEDGTCGRCAELEAATVAFFDE